MNILARIIEPRRVIPAARQPYSTRDILKMMWPLLAEQFLQLVVGLADGMIGLAVGAVYTTVIGHTTGAGDMEASEYYLYKLTRITVVLSTLWNLALTLTLPLYMGFYSTTPEVRALVVSTTLLHNIFTAFVSPLAQSMPSGFKAAGDVKYPMVTSLICTCGIRVALTFLLGVGLRMGLTGYMWAMCIDWSVKAVLMVIHAARGAWKNKRIIGA